jgi:5'-deoxynucleotidase
MPALMSHFFAFMSRLKLIQRWGLMRSHLPENVAEHTLQVAQVAHCIALRKQMTDSPKINPERVAVLALYHDASEVLTGDLPTPIKYANKDITEAYRQVESTANEQLIQMLPPSMQTPYRPLLQIGKEDAEHARIVKMADTLCALLKAQEEVAGGNHEFRQAKATLQQRVNDYNDDAVNWFLERFGPSFSLCLDDMRVPGK